MHFKQMTVLGLFDSSQKYFTIPVYQRAYSWEKDQWNIFLTDLKEQSAGDNNYFYGNLILETIKTDIHYEVIDGQQRLTTLTIFIRALLDVLKKRSETEKEIEVDFDSKEKIYFKNGGNIKLRPVEYDRPCFETLIVEGNPKFETATPSQEKIKDGRSYFYTELDKLSTIDLLKIFDKLETTGLTCIELNGKKDSALMFELQNNRGKDLTNMEKIKSYFMYQMYVYSSEEETETNIESIANVFKTIYLIINDLKSLNEDSALLYHCNAIGGYYSGTVDYIKKEFAKSTDKVKWIKDFVGELHSSFSNIKKMENSNLSYLQDLRELSIPAFVYPFAIKGYKYFDKDEDLNTLYHILEIVVFRYNLVNTRAKITDRLNKILLDFDGDLDKLTNHFKDTFNNEYWGVEYWGDHKTKEILNGYMYQNRVLNYLLWKYEDSIQNRGYSIGSGAIENEQIEHISPQSPYAESIATGYDVDENKEYSEDFVNKKLNCLGNLMLISGSHNASIGNKPFSEKLISYKSNPLLKQQAEVVDFTENSSNKWGAAEIWKRHEKIVDNFAIPKWNFDNV